MSRAVLLLGLCLAAAGCGGAHEPLLPPAAQILPGMRHPWEGADPQFAGREEWEASRPGAKGERTGYVVDLDGGRMSFHVEARAFERTEDAPPVRRQAPSREKLERRVRRWADDTAGGLEERFLPAVLDAGGGAGPSQELAAALAGLPEATISLRVLEPQIGAATQVFWNEIAAPGHPVSIRGKVRLHSNRVHYEVEFSSSGVLPADAEDALATVLLHLAHRARDVLP